MTEHNLTLQNSLKRCNQHSKSLQRTLERCIIKNTALNTHLSSNKTWFSFISLPKSTNIYLYIHIYICIPVRASVHISPNSAAATHPCYLHSFVTPAITARTHTQLGRVIYGLLNILRNNVNFTSSLTLIISASCF